MIENYFRARKKAYINFSLRVKGKNFFVTFEVMVKSQFNKIKKGGVLEAVVTHLNLENVETIFQRERTRLTLEGVECDHFCCPNTKMFCRYWLNVDLRLTFSWIMTRSERKKIIKMDKE